MSYWIQASGYQSESPTTSHVISQNQYITETIFSFVSWPREFSELSFITRLQGTHVTKWLTGITTAIPRVALFEGQGKSLRINPIRHGSLRITSPRLCWQVDFELRSPVPFVYIPFDGRDFGLADVKATWSWDASFQVHPRSRWSPWLSQDVGDSLRPATTCSLGPLWPSFSPPWHKIALFTYKTFIHLPSSLISKQWTCCP